jgi:hypothetical protein
MMRSENITTREAAALLISSLERRGARFILNDDETFRCDLDGLGIDETSEEANTIACAVLTLRDDIRVWLIAQRTTH